jgi:hypothetical protein
VRQARGFSNLSHSQIYNALNRGLVETRKVLGRRMIVFDSLERFLLDTCDDRPPSAFADDPRSHGILRNGDEEPAPKTVTMPRKRGRPRKVATLPPREDPPRKTARW